MKKILLRLFVKNYQQVDNFKVRTAYGTLAGIVGIATNFILCAIKIITGFLTASISIMADGINNLSDAGSSVITLIGFKLSSAPADHKHPFGHQRIEYIAGLIVSIIIIIIGLLLGKSSIEKIIWPEVISVSLVVYIILGISILFKLWQGFFYRSLGKDIDSQALLATATDSINDVISTSAVLISIIIYELTGFIYIDGIIGVIVSIFVIVSGIKMLGETASPLIGAMPAENVVDDLVTIVTAPKEVLGIHDMVIHNYGPKRIFATIHVEVDRHVDVMISHDMIDNLEREVREHLGIELVIHMDPVDINDPETMQLKEKILSLIHNYDAKLTIHDFRVVHGITHTNVLFDVVKPIEYHLSKEELKLAITQLIMEEDSFLHPVIEVDDTYTI